VRRTDEAIRFDVTVFGAEEDRSRRRVDAQGRAGHAEVRIGDGVAGSQGWRRPCVEALDELAPQNHGPATARFRAVIPHVPADDPGATMARAVAAGATVVFAVEDHPYGRMGRFRAPFGYPWIVSGIAARTPAPRSPSA
jgi:PhnB protein